MLPYPAGYKKKPHLMQGVVASPRIELGSGASETLILSIVLRGQLYLFSQMRKITAKYFNRNGEQYYTEKFSDHCHTIWSYHFFYPIQRFKYQKYDNTVNKNTNENIYIKVIGF